VSQRRRYAAIVVLFLIGFAMVALADALDSVWPLFVTPFVYALIPWLVTRPDDWPEGSNADVPADAGA
jgi:hypothetical protein